MKRNMNNLRISMKKIILLALMIATSVNAKIQYDADAKVLWKTSEEGLMKDLRECVIMDACYYMAKAYSEGKTLDEAIEIGTHWIKPREMTPTQLADLEKLMKD